jgi:two-component system response regulator (stage 0 sporulation protein A)
MQSDKIRVILADDNLLLCQIVTDYLNKQPDIELVDVVHDGQEAFEKIRKEKPHIVILDCAMPKVDGLGVLENLGSESNRPICIMLTGIRNDAVTRRAYDLGADYYIIKPFDLDVLGDRIRMFKDFNPSRYKQELEDYKRGLNRDEDDEQGWFETQLAVSVASPHRPSIEEQVTDLLREIGVPANIRGYRCLRAAIMISVENLDLLHFVTRQLYPSIAEQLETTPSSVERAIRHAIGIVWENGNIAELERLFGYSVSTRKKKPSNSEFIALIADKFRLANQAS